MPNAERDNRYELERIRHQSLLQSITKFRFFFSGLIFAVLSYSIQKPIESVNIYIIWAENIAWILLLISGLLSIRECGGLNAKLTEDNVLDGLSDNYRKLMYYLFISAITLLVLSKITYKLST